ncbi:MAG: crossover junction endodeoxyribonuclease RuvC [Arachnia sp.]
MGIDPGLTRCGVGIVDGTVGRPPTFVAVGVVRTDPALDVARRLAEIAAGLDEWFDEYTPEAVAIERVFAQHNLGSVIDTAQASGVAALLGARRGLPVTYHTPSEVKAAVTGSGSADKAQVGAMVARILRLASPPKPADAADALALAICHAWRGGHTNRYAAAAAEARSRR